MENAIKNTVKEYLCFEQEASVLYPFMEENPTDIQIDKIVAFCRSDDTEEIHEACEKYDVDAMLERLYSLTEKENDGVKLSEAESAEYLKLVDELHNLDAEIPFGIEI